MNISILPSGVYATNAYVVSCPDTKDAVIIDPSPESTAKIQKIITHQALNPKAILLTHSHWDHIADVHPLKISLQIPVFVHNSDAPNLIKPGSDLLRLLVPIIGVEPDGFLEEGTVFPVGKSKLEVIHTPGHSVGSICFYEPSAGILFSGDTLFQGTIGNLSFPTSRPQLMADSLRKLTKLPGKTKVYPGHGPMTTLEDEYDMLMDIINQS